MPPTNIPQRMALYISELSARTGDRIIVDDEVSLIDTIRAKFDRIY